jgi:transcriptional antiterminator
MKEILKMHELLQGKKITVKEMAKKIGCSPETIKGHIRDLFPGLMQNGKVTWLDKKQITVILEKMKQAVSSGTVSNLQSQIIGTETALTPGLKLEILYRQIDEIKTAEIAGLKQDREVLQSSGTPSNGSLWRPGGNTHGSPSRNTATGTGTPWRRLLTRTTAR